MATLSVVMMVKDEAVNLRRCLPRLASVADEIVILDSGSTDESETVAAQYGARWFVNTDWQGYGVQRQRAQALATGDWIFARIFMTSAPATATSRRGCRRICANAMRCAIGRRTGARVTSTTRSIRCRCRFSSRRAAPTAIF